MTTPQRIDDQVEAAAAIATAMALELSPRSRAELTELRADGWRACVEFSFDADGRGYVYLTATSPEGVRRLFGQVMHEGVH